MKRGFWMSSCLLTTCALLTFAVRAERVLEGFEYPSPSGEAVAKFYARIGGGAGGWAFTYVAVRRSGDEPPVDVLKLSHGYEVCAIWKSDGLLEIRYPRGADVVEKKDEVRLGGDTIRVSYSAVSGDRGVLQDKACEGRRADLSELPAQLPRHE